MDLQYNATQDWIIDNRRSCATTITDIDQLLAIYRSVAATPNPGLARHAEKIGRDNAEALTFYRAAKGIWIVALPGDALVGEGRVGRVRRVRLPDGRIEDNIPMAHIAVPASRSV